MTERDFRPLHALAEVQLGRQRSPEHAEGPFMVPYLRAANVKDGYLDLSDVKEMNFTPAEQQVFSLRSSDVLVSEGAGSLTAVGASAVWDGSMGGVVCFQNTLLRLRPRPSVAISRFLAWWARHAYASGLFASAAIGVNIYHLSADRVRSLPVRFPGIAAQERVADFLDRETARIDAVIGKKQSLLEGLADRRRSDVFHGVTGQLYASSDFHDPGLPWTRAVRRPWPVVRIKHVAKLGTGHTPSRSHPEYWEKCTIPWITTGEIQQVRDDRAEVITDTREKISSLGLENSAAAVHPAGTVVLCRTASAGFSAIMGEEMATSQDFATWTCSDRLLPRYLLMCLRAMRRDLLGRLAFGSTHKTIYMPDIESLKIPLPTVEQQREVLADIDRRLEGIDALTERLQHQLALLVEHRQALITAAVTGELHVASEVA